MSDNKLRNTVKKFLFPVKLKYRQVLGGERMKPSFIIVGAQKAGTTSLYKYLTQHPEIKSTLLKEVHYFDLNYDKPLSWYESFYPSKRDDKIITGEASPYYMFHPLAIQRIAKFDSTLKIIVLLRDPAKRAISHYYHEVRKGREKLGMRKAFEAEHDRLKGELEKIEKNPSYNSNNYQRYSYQSRGIYVDQIKKIKDRFEDNNIMIIDSVEFFNQTKSTVQRVIEFVGVNNEFNIKTNKRFNVRNGFKDPDEEEIYSELKVFYKEHNEALYNLIGKRFDWN